MLRLAAALLLLLVPATAAACPNVHLMGGRREFSAAALEQGWSMELRAGGPFRLQACRLNVAKGPPLSGFAGGPPQISARIRGFSAQALVMRVDSDCDATLLVNTPNELWLFAGGQYRTAEIRIRRPSEGLYDIWIGAQTERGCQAILRLGTEPVTPGEDLVRSIFRP